MKSARTLSPAKINLGLEILGKRDDGFHEIRTIMQAISLTDQISVTAAATNSIESSDSTLENDDNLALRAATLWTERLDASKRSLAISMRKSIPVAAGLGGASSNAATVLTLARALYAAPVVDSDLDSVAASLGSDVPFFLHSTAALASGRGEMLDPLPPLADATFILVTPNVEIARKTVTMYGQLTPSDFSDGSGIASLAARMVAGNPLESGDLRNAFERPLLHFLPELEGIPSIMRSLCGHRVGLSGAGPTWYAAVNSPDEANRLAASLCERLLNVRVETAQALTLRPEIEFFR
ncbi:4-(cytidine 5'-diphospho)-2-C-methyl-D-erythritol kinase [soil metagenome]